MAYTKFKKIAQLREIFGIIDQVNAWLPTDFKPVNVSEFLKQALIDAKEEALATEKAKSEYIIAPMLKELRRNNPNKFSSFSGYQFDVDKSLNLNGFCDFILSVTPQKVEIDIPIFCLVEAKNGEIENGFAQCTAEMYAAQLYNERHHSPQKAIYGCVTNAFSWAFLKLEGKHLLIDSNYIPLNFNDPDKVLGVLQWILDESIAN